MYRSLTVAIRAFHQVIERLSTGQLLSPFAHSINCRVQIAAIPSWKAINVPRKGPNTLPYPLKELCFGNIEIGRRPIGIHHAGRIGATVLKFSGHYSPPSAINLVATVVALLFQRLRVTVRISCRDDRDVRDANLR